jgi:hypothetical protein
MSMNSNDRSVVWVCAIIVLGLCLCAGQCMYNTRVYYDTLKQAGCVADSRGETYKIVCPAGMELVDD